MKVIVPIGNLTFEIEVKDEKDAIAKIGELQNVFTHTTCGVCGSTETRYVHTQNDGYNFYEIRCTAKGCYARLKFGQKKEGGTLFPKLKDEDGSYKPNGGWERWEGHKDDEPPASVPPSNQQPWPSSNKSHKSQVQDLPSRDYWAELKDLLLEMGVEPGDTRMGSAVCQYCTKDSPEGPVTLEIAYSVPVACKRAVELIESARRTYPDNQATPLLSIIREWIKGGKR